MSIRIYNDGLAGTSASQAERTQAATVGSNSPAKRDSGPINSSGDGISISSLSERIATASHVDDVQQAAKVRALASLYQSGQYHVDSLQLSRSLISQALDEGVAGVG